jgi:thiol-disulfide isomerase/thioredoxin
MNAEPRSPHSPEALARTLSARQAWFLGVAALAVVLTFAFVILPYVDPKPARLSGPALADFELDVLGPEAGARVRLSELRGKPVVLDFWASWCAPCREQSKALSAFARAQADQVHVLGISTGDERSAAGRFVLEHAPAYVNVFDESGAVARSIDVRVLPTLVVLDASGAVRSVASRTFSEGELERHLAEVLR